jgi:hypothetical protein
MDMKTELVEKTHNTHSNFATVCLASCRKLLDRIAKVKQAVLDEFHNTLDAHNKMLRLALNEAEALAWETDYPHLVFPTLAHEKAEEVTSWQARQREVKRSHWERDSQNGSPSHLAAAFSTR